MLKEAGVSHGTAGSFKSQVGDNLDSFPPCQAGCGLMTKSMHSQFNLAATCMYKTTPNPLDRLMCIVKEHYLKVFPQIQSATHPKQKRLKLTYRCNMLNNSNTIFILMCLH